MPARGPYKVRPIEDRFAEKVDFGGSNGCWLWTGFLNHGGYGSFRVDGRTRNAHRAAWLIFVGSLSDELQLDHLCRVRHCVNPDHLEPVTHAENLIRSPLTIQGRNVRKTHCPQGHPYSGANLLIVNGGRGCRTCHYAANRLRSARKREGNS